MEDTVPAAASNAKFNRIITEALTTGPKRVREIYRIVQEQQPSDCTSVPCPHRKKSNKSMEWQHEIQRQLARIATNRDGLWHLKTSAAVEALSEEPTIPVEIEEDDLPPVVVVLPSAPYTGDPFIVTASGHFMDEEELKKPEDKRFAVPMDFDEFYAWRPDYVLNWVKKRLNRYAVDDEVEDWTQDLLIHLRYLPQGSKYRQPGANGRSAGCQDVIETFSPIHQYGASERRFRNYINSILANKFLTVQSKRSKNPVLRPGNIPFGANDDEGGEHSFAGDEFVHRNSDYLAASSDRQSKQHDDRLLTNQFKQFVAQHDPVVYPALEALESTGTIGEAAKFIGVSDSEFSRARARLKQLGECFQKGLPVPKQRRPYKKRTRAAAGGTV